MRIILKGKADDEQKIHEKLKKLGKGDFRSFGYLLYELAGLADLDAINSRLDNIAARREEIGNIPGMKKSDPLIDARKLKEILNNTIQNLCNSDSNSSYDKIIARRKNGLEAWDWEPSNKDNAAVTYLRGLMCKLAAECITEAGGQS